MAYGKFNMTIEPDENLGKIIGNKPQSPSEMIKNLWIYIKKNNLAHKGTA